MDGAADGQVAGHMPCLGEHTNVIFVDIRSQFNKCCKDDHLLLKVLLYLSLWQTKEQIYRRIKPHGFENHFLTFPVRSLKTVYLETNKHKVLVVDIWISRTAPPPPIPIIFRLWKIDVIEFPSHFVLFFSNCLVMKTFTTIIRSYYALYITSVIVEQKIPSIDRTVYINNLTYIEKNYEKIFLVLVRK